MKSQLTNRKFYNKWLYKVTLSLKGSNIFRTIKPNVHSIPLYLNGTLLKLAVTLKNIANYQLRIEGHKIDIYINEIEHFNLLINDFKNQLIHQFEPHVDLSASNSKDIIVKKLPFDLYRYKVFLKPHNIKNAEDKRQIITWLESQTPRIRISSSTKSWFIITNWNWDRRYVYVENDESLLLLRLRCPSALGSIHRYKISDK